MSECRFQQDWAGKCKVESGRFHYCEKHRGKLCGIKGCKRQATHSCSMTLQFVCGFYLCDSHTTALHWGHREQEVA